MTHCASPDLSDLHHLAEDGEGFGETVKACQIFSHSTAVDSMKVENTSKSQSRSWSNRGSVDMVFMLRQIQQGMQRTEHGSV